MLLHVYFKAPNEGPASSHPIHIHGHNLQIVKIGWPEYNTTTGSFIKNSEDINCLVPSCNKATWADSSWKDGNIPDITLAGAPEKDTISLPIGGYVVARFKADNPGQSCCLLKIIIDVAGIEIDVLSFNS